MKKFVLHFILGLALVLPYLVYGQNAPSNNYHLDSTIVWELGASFNQIDERPARSLYGNFKAYATERLSVGLSFAFFQRNTSERFGQDVQRPQLGYGEAGLVASQTLLGSRRFRLGVAATTGYATAKIVDRAVTETQTVVYANEDFFFAQEQEIPKEVVRSHFFQFRPELNASILFGRHFGIQASGGYNYLLGKSRFASISDFDGWVGRVGVILIIPTDE